MSKKSWVMTAVPYAVLYVLIFLNMQYNYDISDQVVRLVEMGVFGATGGGLISAGIKLYKNKVKSP